ncbi:RNA methyltransferase [Rickettsiella grylli]|uniref:RNA methyltransferase n=1 Tax=Rickettsiella grylli TaxID=59196 RepID=UPI0008FD38B7|nr:RNA methyltransferase [Rickettsiella grylli]OIZ99902.1 RNA methyltransferase [Rickettsiella grylli]
MPLSQLRIVLVKTTCPGNIGATARAMKTMGLKQLYLVAPQSFPHINASVRASHAIDILADAIVVDQLEEALGDCQLVFGTSTRVREFNWVSLTPRVAAEKIMNHCQQKIAILFGQERCGLTNKELQRCHFQMTIPANPEYNSLNLAAAVQIVCYELRNAFLQEKNIKKRTVPLADVKQHDYFYGQLQERLKKIEFLKPNRSQHVMDKLRRIFSRAELDSDEIKILQGIFSALEKKESPF